MASVNICVSELPHLTSLAHIIPLSSRPTCPVAPSNLFSASQKHITFSSRFPLNSGPSLFFPIFVYGATNLSMVFKSETSEFSLIASFPHFPPCQSNAGDLFSLKYFCKPSIFPPHSHCHSLVMSLLADIIAVVSQFSRLSVSL